WHRELWIIDNGASFYFHHSWKDFEKHALNPFPHIKNHVWLPQATKLDETDRWAKEHLSDHFFLELTRLIPDEWLQWRDTNETPEEIRHRYYLFLKTRLTHSHHFSIEARHARG